MADLPIIFSGPMVCAQVEGRKTMTRRLLYSLRKVSKRGMCNSSMLQGYPPIERFDPATHFPSDHGPDKYWNLTGWHKVRPGDRLWVREAITRSGGYAQYVANHKTTTLSWPPHWKRDTAPGMHMPRHLSRLTWAVTSVKFERLQEISEADAVAEGVETLCAPDGGRGVNVVIDGKAIGNWMFPRRRDIFEALWTHLHGPDAWDANPWVVAIGATVIQANIDSLEKAA